MLAWIVLRVRTAPIIDEEDAGVDDADDTESYTESHPTTPGDSDLP